MMTSVFLAVLRSFIPGYFFSLLRLDPMIGTIDDGLTTLIHTHKRHYQLREERKTLTDGIG